METPLNLPWLPEPPSDLRARLKALRNADEIKCDDLVRLASHRLDLSQLGQLSRILAKRAEAIDAQHLPIVRLGICASHTADLLAESLPATILRHGLHAQLYQAEYGQMAQAVFDNQSGLARFEPDLVFLSLDASSLGLDRPILEPGKAQEAVDGALAHVQSLSEAVRANCGASAIVHSLPAPLLPLLGSLDANQPGTPRWMISQFNRQLQKKALANGDLFVDFAALAELVGTSNWHDPQRWHEAKLPIALPAIPLAADHLARVIGASRGRSRKCLVLDLDNTLWGGVIGDDGLEGIVIGQGSAQGEAFLALQAFAADLRNRGIVLAVCSKNEEDAARLPFRQHEDMLLNEDDFAVFVANWNDKASNLQTIAQTLNIGTDALVFLDDNPAERERVRQELPEVAVPELGDEPADYPALLALAGYFEALSFGEEDRGRAGMYQANAHRVSALQSIGNMDEYLASLEMECTIKPFDELGRARIAQLVNKSNQFNLTTKRYSESDIAGIEADPDALTIQVRLKDRFGDNGMISVVIFERGESDWHCDTWLMSCRVLGRRVEEAVLAQVVEAARTAGAKRLTGDYIPTPKNRLVKDHYAKLGFTKIAELDGGGARWALELENYTPSALPMVVVGNL